MAINHGVYNLPNDDNDYVVTYEYFPEAEITILAVQRDTVNIREENILNKLTKEQVSFLEEAIVLREIEEDLYGEEGEDDVLADIDYGEEDYDYGTNEEESD